MSLCVRHDCPGLKCQGKGFGCPMRQPNYQQLPMPLDEIDAVALAGLRESAARYMEGETDWVELDSVAKAARRKRINEARQGE